MEGLLPLFTCLYQSVTLPLSSHDRSEIHNLDETLEIARSSAVSVSEPRSCCVRDCETLLQSEEHLLLTRHFTSLTQAAASPLIYTSRSLCLCPWFSEPFPLRMFSQPYVLPQWLVSHPPVHPFSGFHHLRRNGFIINLSRFLRPRAHFFFFLSEIRSALHYVCMVSTWAAF